MNTRFNSSVAGPQVPIRSRFAFACVISLGCGSLAAQESAESPAANEREEPSFDVGMLERRGIDPRLVKALSREPGLAPGEQRVSIMLNARPRGQHTVLFGEDGQPCITPRLIDQLGLRAPPKPATDEADGQCVALRAAYPGAQVDVDPETLSLHLVLSAHMIAQDKRTIDFATGGNAALANYQFNTTETNVGDRTTRHSSLNSELGFNAGEWKFRSRQVLTHANGSTDNTHLDAYAQRAIADYRALLQVGEINLQNPLLPGAQITGAQVTSESALALQPSGAVVEGVAGSQARVEVRQQGVLIYTTVVQPGPFLLRDVPRLNRQSNLEVTVIEEDGARRDFIVPASFQDNRQAGSGYTFGVGKVRDLQGGLDEPWAASAGWTGALGRLGPVTAGVLAAEGYSAAAVGSSTVLPGAQTQLQWSVASSRMSNDDSTGTQAQLMATQSIGRNWQFGLSGTWQSEGYRELLDVTLPDSELSVASRSREQYAATLGWYGSRIGSVNARLSDVTLFNGDRSQRGGLSWGRQWNQVSANLSADWDISGNTSDSTVYFNISVPLGASSRLSGRYRDSGSGGRVGIGASGAVNDQVNYRVNVDQRVGSGDTDLYLGMSAIPRYAQVDMNYSRQGSGADTVFLGARGGVVVHGEGVTASPYPIGESFAILSVGDASGVKIDTPSGTVWTDTWGRAVAPYLNPYVPNQVRVQTHTLPRNSELNNGAAELKVGRASVEHVKFGLSQVSRVLLVVSDESGNTLPAGGTVSDGENLLAFVQDGGQVFLSDYTPGTALWLEREGQPACRIEFGTPARPHPDSPYETASATCRVDPTKLDGALR